MKRWPATALASLLVVCLALSAQAQVPDAPAEPEAQEGAEIRVESPQDEAIENRITTVLEAIEGLEETEVSVTAGVTTISGTVPNARTRRAILDLASRVEGVIFVQDRLEEDVELSSRLLPTTRRFQDMGINALRLMPLILVAMLVVGIFWFLGQWAGNREAWLRRLGLTELAVNLARRIVRLVIIGIGLLIALEILDATALVGALLGVAGVAGIAVGFAFRNIAENYLAGVMLSARNPFNIGDLVQVGTFLGKVVRLTSRDTVLMTTDGNHLRIPNSVIITSTLTNFTRNPLRLFLFKLHVSLDSDLLLARQIALKAICDMPVVLTEPGPQVLIMEISETSIQLQMSGWIDQTATDLGKARSEAIRLVKHAFDCHGVAVAQAAMRVHLQDTGERIEEQVGRHSGGQKGSPRAVTSPQAQPETTTAWTQEHVESADLSADPAIDQQLRVELSNSEEENLLVNKSGGD